MQLKTLSSLLKFSVSIPLWVSLLSASVYLALPRKLDTLQTLLLSSLQTPVLEVSRLSGLWSLTELHHQLPWFRGLWTGMEPGCQHQLASSFQMDYYGTRLNPLLHESISLINSHSHIYVLFLYVYFCCLKLQPLFRCYLFYMHCVCVCLYTCLLSTEIFII